jgi:hypothetical protein
MWEWGKKESMRKMWEWRKQERANEKMLEWRKRERANELWAKGPLYLPLFYRGGGMRVFHYFP